MKGNTDAEKEKIVRLWFDMWLQQRDLGIDKIFSHDAIYIESWGPEYKGIEKIKWWFQEWNTRGKVLVWEIKQYFHKENQTVVEWYFENFMEDGKKEAFEGVSLILWSEEGKISSLKEFGCHIGRYDPYQASQSPCFREEKPMWF